VATVVAVPLRRLREASFLAHIFFFVRDRVRLVRAPTTTRVASLTVNNVDILLLEKVDICHRKIHLLGFEKYNAPSPQSCLVFMGWGAGPGELLNSFPSRARQTYTASGSLKAIWLSRSPPSDPSPSPVRSFLYLLPPLDFRSLVGARRGGRWWRQRRLELGFGVTGVRRASMASGSRRGGCRGRWQRFGRW
jgi:hypothetical protein